MKQFGSNKRTTVTECLESANDRCDVHKEMFEMSCVIDRFTKLRCTSEQSGNYFGASIKAGAHNVLVKSF